MPCGLGWVLESTRPDFNAKIPKCRSCGITLQCENKKGPGYYIKQAGSAVAKNYKKELDSVYELVLQGLSEEDKKLLGYGADASRKERVLPEAKAEKKNSALECLRCRQAKFQSKFESNEFPIEPAAQIMEKVPPWANIVYVVSAQDFPLLLNKKVFEFHPAKQIQFVFTKADLLFPHNKAAQEKGLSFFQDYMERTYKVPREQVFVVSGHVNWGISNLLEHLKDDSFLIGSVNSGKSTLLQSLVYIVHLLKSKAPNARKERELQKIEDRLGPAARTRQRIKDLAEFKAKHGPGVSFMPGFTRNVIPFELSASKTVFDVPGFGSTETDNLHEILSPAAMKQLLKGVKFHKYGAYDSHYDTVKEGQTLTVGGLFFLTVPPQSMYRVRNMINHPIHVFRDHDKAVDSWKNAADRPAIQDVFLTDSSRTELVRYEIPLFVGSFELVLKSLGFITITATGALPETMSPAVIYLPRQISASVREPIGKYITKTLTGRDKNGNPLKKENWARLSTKEVRRYVGHEPFCRDLIWNEKYG
ncbi:genetic interactor of prohibitins 3, mitochondrial [Metschnikowia bicuspidata]|uniref:Genetic interactor of prohibitins 3, mitochondrial n=1 Tax=Metschnikowia bicuspidata TaxID=27322 RepID=A0A4P9ZFE6_9ASCO|nr:genetic interactor of prohibitins 3, mitochondrial [Metschnikowia bicuspidata]